MINNYIKADLWRISQRIPRIICNLLVAVVFGIYVWNGSKGDSWNSVFFMERMLRGITMTALVYGILEFMAVFADDFKAKTMQVSIGAGMKRRHVILTKWLDAIFLVMTDLLFIVIVGLLMGAVTGIFINSEQMADLLIRYLGEMIGVTGYLSLSLIAVFYMQSVLVPLIIYICLSLNIFKMILEYIVSIEALQQLNLDRFIFTNTKEMFISRLTVGSFDFKLLVVILVYIIGGYVVSGLLFKKKELEF